MCDVKTATRMGESSNDRQGLIAQEDMAAPSTTVVTMQPGVFTFPELKTEMWSSGICDCCEDMSTCCFGFWCPCCLACQVSADFGECLCMPLLGLFAGYVPALTLVFRSSMRERYHIQGSMCDDCCTSTFCPICTWCQMAREIKTRRRRLSTVTTTNIVTEVNMNPPPYAPQFSMQPQYPMSSGGYTPLTGHA